MAKSTAAASEMFLAKGAGDIYAALVNAARNRLGANKAVEDPKQTCVHLTAGMGGTAFAGVHPRKAAVLLNIRLKKPLKSSRVRKIEQASTHRFHCEMILTSPSDVDAELLGWLDEAYQLAADR
jgi:Domain of unknown function (DUF5655)